MNAAYIEDSALKEWRAKFKKEKRRKQPEGQIAEGLVKWFAYCCKGFGVPDARLLVHIPNEPRTFNRKALIQGAILKRQGLRRGFPDFFLFVSRGGLSGLALELKSKNGKTSEEQDEMLSLLENQGYRVKVVFSLDQALSSITEYLNLK